MEEVISGFENMILKRKNEKVSLSDEQLLTILNKQFKTNQVNTIIAFYRKEPMHQIVKREHLAESRIRNLAITAADKVYDVLTRQSSICSSVS